MEGAVVVGKLLEHEGSDTWGYNAATNTYEDLVKAGIIDPVKVGLLCTTVSVTLMCALAKAALICGPAPCGLINCQWRSGTWVASGEMPCCC